MKKILIISVLCNIAFSSFIMGMQQPTEAELELFEAIDKEDVERVQQLIDEGVNFRKVQFYKGRMIFSEDLAAEKGKESEIFKIIQDVYAAKLTPYDRFFAAIKEDDLGKNIPKIEKIVINSLIQDVDHPKDKDGNTALILAVQKNDIPLVLRLLTWKADINIQNTKGESAFALAIKSKNKLLITALLENAYDIEIDQPDSDGNTPLMLAVQTDIPEIIEKIVAEVPNPDIENLKNETAYNFAEGTTNKKKILELLEKAKKQYALHEAIQNKNFGVIKKSDASLNITSAERNPLVVAISQKNKKLVEEIIDKGADVNQILRGNRTPLRWAALRANSDTFKLLLEKGANPDVADIYNQYTPIFLALINNKYDRVQDLIKYKANINLQAYSYYSGELREVTPLMLAAQRGKSDFVKILLDAGADPLLKNSEGQTAFDLARENDTRLPSVQEIITLLENKIKTIPSKPFTPTTTPTTSAQLMSLLQNLTQQLRILERRLAV